MAAEAILPRVAVLALAMVALASCREALPPPPPAVTLAGLPLSGSLADARAAGFTRCVADNVGMRCRREGVMFEGAGPLSGAVDLAGSEGEGGFDHLVLWHASDQAAVVAVTTRLRAEGWTECLTPTGEQWAEQAVTYRAGAPFFVSVDRSYWGSRRMRVWPVPQTAIPACGTPKG